MGQLVNQTELGRDVALPQPKVHRYLNLLETSYLLMRLPAYTVNRIKRLIKSPKLYWGDTGVALHLTQEAEPGGAHLENLVLNDLLTWRDARLDRAEAFYWRTSIGEEVDFVIETRDRLLPIEVQAAYRRHHPCKSSPYSQGRGTTLDKIKNLRVAVPVGALYIFPRVMCPAAGQHYVRPR